MSPDTEMSPFKRRVLWLIFFGGFGFAGGGAFLLYGLVPLEHHLAVSGMSQKEIDQTLSFCVYGWGLLALIVTTAYSHLTLLRARPKAAFSLAAIMVLSSCLVFYEFLNAKSLMVVGKAAKVEEVSQHLAFGPYPDKDQLKLLKEQGYNGVISLLHPAIPFEEVLLREEKQNTQDVDMKFYSFPMLPWISDNKAALSGIRALIQQPDQRLYVHCYLGQHRANLVRRMAGYGSSTEEAGENHELPDHLERGLLFSYLGKRVAAGPFPTDEEWFGVILRYGVREVVSTLNPNSADDQRLMEKMRQIGRDYAFTITERPLNRAAPDPQAVQQLAEYLKKSKGKVYVVGFKTDAWQYDLDKAMGGHEELVSSPIAQDKFDRGPLLKVNDSVVLGPYPTEAEVEVLKKAGVRAVVSLLDDNEVEWAQKEDKWARDNHFVLRRFPIKPGDVTRSQLEDVSVFVFNQPGLTYVHSFQTDSRVRDLYHTMRQMIRE